MIYIFFIGGTFYPLFELLSCGIPPPQNEFQNHRLFELCRTVGVEGRSGPLHSTYTC